jgi:hypothetical protein
MQPVLELIRVMEGELSQTIIYNAWCTCGYLTWEENNVDILLSEGGVALIMNALDTYTDIDMIMVILFLTLCVARYRPRDLLHTDLVDRFIQLAAHNYQAISYVSCGVMTRLITQGSAIWPDVDKKKVTSCIMSTVSRWNMAEDMKSTAPSLVIYKEDITNTHHAVQYITAWRLCRLITHDPSRWCPMVARVIGLDLLDTQIHNDQLCTEARPLLQKVIDQCNKHK